jgi:hypothetical protein
MKPAFAKMLSSSRAKPVESGEYGIAWVAELRFYARDWYADRSITSAAVESLSRARWWGELECVGVAHRAGAPFGSVDDVTAAFATGEPTVVNIGRGKPEVALWHEDPDAVLKLDASPSSLEIMFRLMRGSLERHRDAVLADFSDAIHAIAGRARDRGRLAYCVGFPFPANRIVYPRTRPPRTALRRLDAVMDIVDPALPADLVSEVHVDDSRAIGTAAAPPEAQRTERDGLVALRWVVDPTDRAAMEVACAAHERWVAPLLHTEIAVGWSADGDLEVPVGSPRPRPEPLTVVDAADGMGYLDVVVGDGDQVDDAAWQSAVTAARKRVVKSGTKLTGVALVAQDRAAALRIAGRARAADLRPLYRRDGRIWDPFPPGTWQDPS